MPNYHSFTVKYGKIIENLLTPINILPVGNTSVTITPVRATGLWDTGATKTCIKPWICDKLNLRLLTPKTRLFGIGGELKPRITFINIRLMNNVEINNCSVYVADMPGFTDVLIGMDIISKGNFSICNTNNKTLFSFIIPPYPKYVDYAAITNADPNLDPSPPL